MQKARQTMGRFQHGGDTYGMSDVVDFSASLNPLGMPVQVIRALKVAAASFEAYPDPQCRELVAALSDHEQVPAEHIVPTAGASDAFARISAALKPDKAMVCSPCYSGYEQALHLLRPRVVHHSLVARENFDLTERVLDYIDPEIDLIVLCSPNNPTGRVISHELLIKVLHEAERCGSRVLVDECFIDFTDSKSCTSLLEEFPNLVMVKALTKSHAMAGFRLGYCLSADSALVSELRASGAPWAVSSPAQVAGVAALSVSGYLELTREYVAKERQRLEEGLSECGMSVVPSHANFILFQSPVPLYDEMLARGYVIRRCENFRGLDDSWFRIAVRTTVQNKGFLAALEDVMAKQG